MKRWLWLPLLAAAGGAVWLATRAPALPEIPFARVRRETLTSLLATNGKTEPSEWSPVHTTHAGRLVSLAVEKGRAVRSGEVIATLDAAGTASEIAAAEARLAQARADLALFERGGRPVEIAEIDSSLDRARLDRAAAAREEAALARLAARNAATSYELQQVRDRIARLDADIAALQKKRATLVAPSDRPAAEARLKDAESALQAARLRLEQATIRSPRDGAVYEIPVRPGDWLETGALVAKVGRLDRLRVVVYVDEPDLGKVREGLPVTLTWDALPGLQWSGVVEKKPLQVVPVGTRQVGEVITVADNPSGNLPPGANINARIRAQVVENALAIPKAALRRQDDHFGVFVLDGAALAWRTVEVGVSSETRAEVKSGLKEGEAVALPSERSLAPGMAVRAVYP
jgi:HlyD family secretion protein